MDNDIFYINKNKEPQQYSYTYYTIFGNHSSLDEENNPLTESKEQSLAYIKYAANESQYYIKVGLHGKVFNPIGLFSEGKQNKFLAKVGKNEYNFAKVNSKVFNMYLNFLRTKNIAWLNNAEREMT